MDRVIALNEAHQVELSPLTPRDLAGLIGSSFHAEALCGGEAFMIAFDDGADYGSPNFAWFKERYASFVYVDRLAVAKSARGQGVARQLYAGLLDAVRAAGIGMIACEVNVDPPNVPSDLLHASMGFTEVGRAVLASGKAVRYLVLEV